MPKNMAQLVKRLMVNLTSLKPNPILAIPVIEFLTDACSVDEFHRFFQVYLIGTCLSVLVFHIF